MGKKNNQKKKKIGLFKTAARTVPYIIKMAPLLFLVGCVVMVVQSLLQSLQIYVLEDIFDGAAQLASGGVTPKAMIIAICIYAGTFIITQALSQLANYTDTRFNQISGNRQRMDMYEKMTRLEPILFEDTDMLDDIEKANNGIDSSRNLISTLKHILLFHLPYIAIVSAYLVKREPLLVLALVIIFLPTLFQQYMIKKLYRDKEDASAPMRRKKDYYSGCITAGESFKETRMLGAYKYFIKGYRELLKTLLKLDIKTSTKKELMYLLTTVFSLAGTLAVYYLLFIFLMDGRISVGEFAAVFTSLGMIKNRLHSLFYGSFGAISQELPNIENYVRFLSLPAERAPECELPRDCEISLENVTFSYPNQEKNALDGVSFKVKPRETVAIVGENGSGKSTLIKLITGYYVPKDGKVTYNGKSTADMAFSSVAKHLSAVYQRYPHYALTLKENLMLGQIDKEPSEEAMRKACSMAGFTPEESWLPNGFETMLSREFDGGVGLSGGQVQRISIARAFYRDSDIIILDEPTAAIDPIEEAKIYRRFAELSKDRTSFIVTHRLASVKIADRIIMMKDGKAVEIGTHEELMAQNGEYKKMYDSQRQWYEASVS